MLIIWEVLGIERSRTLWVGPAAGPSENDSGLVEPSIEIDGNVRWVGAGGFLRKWLHISLDQDHLAQNTILLSLSLTENNTLPWKQWRMTRPQKEGPMSWSWASTFHQMKQIWLRLQAHHRMRFLTLDPQQNDRDFKMFGWFPWSRSLILILEDRMIW